jgi:two-component system nitrogen regulation response regulator NtrX
MEDVAPSPFFVTPSPFLSPRAEARSLPGDAVPNEVRRDAVPSEARDASLSLGTTKNGGSAGQSEGHYRVWRFLASLETTEKAVAPCLLFLSPRAQARGPSALTRLGKTRWEAVTPSASEGSLGTECPEFFFNFNQIRNIIINGMKTEVWVLDDEKPICEVLVSILQDEGYSARSFILARDFLKALKEQRPKAVFLDLWLKDADGMEVLAHLKKEYPEIPVIIISGHGTVESAVKAIKLGAFDFIEKPLSYERVLLTLEQALKFTSLEEENRRLRSALLGEVKLTGSSKAVEELRKLINRVAKLDTTVLIYGESGVGKEVVARLIHLNSNRRDKPFIEVNSAAIPETLLEAELFGFEKGAFTDARSAKKGKFELAHGGTIFLDEIGDMSLSAQAKLLRVLQEKKIERLGGSQPITVDVRVIAATNKDLEELIAQGKFREDLYYRLNVFPIRVPALRERKEDIPLLVEEFLAEFALKMPHRVKRLAPEVIELFLNYCWPGNVRELKNTVERLIIYAGDKEEITLSDLPPDLISQLEGRLKLQKEDRLEPWFTLKDYRLAKRQFEREYLKRRLEENDWNVSQTAREIGIERAHLQKKIKELGLKP